MQSEWLAGVSECSITPPVGTPLLGCIQRSSGINDELYARLLVLTDGNQSALLAGIDLIGMDFETADEIREEIARATCIQSQFLNYSHNHSGPFTIPWSVLGWRWMNTQGREWRRDVVRKIARAAEQAVQNLQKVILRAGRASVQIGINRRCPTTTGIVMKPYPQGTVVPWVDVLRVDRADGAPFAVLFSHAAHPLIIHGASRLISADFIVGAVREIRRQLGDSVLPVFCQQCCADINGSPLRGGINPAVKAGEKLAAAALKAWETSVELPRPPLQCVSQRLALPFQDLPPLPQVKALIGEAESRLNSVCDISKLSEEQLWDIQDTVEIGSESTSGTDDVQPMEGRPWWLQDTVLCLREVMKQIESNDDHRLRFEIQGLRIASAWSLIGMTHELFADYQLWYDTASRAENTMVLAYTNACESYVPTDIAFQEGGYEAVSLPSIGGASLRYRHRRTLRFGVEATIKEALLDIWNTAPTPSPVAAAR